MEQKQTILYGVLAVLVLAVGYLGYSNYQLRAGTGLAGGPNEEVSATKPEEFDIGQKSIPAENVTDGIVISASANKLVMKTEDSASTSYTINASTEIFLDEGLKDMDTYQKELEAYNAQVEELMKDQVKNKEALQNLVLPSMSILTPVTAADIRTDDIASVFLADARSATALKIVIAERAQ